MKYLLDTHAYIWYVEDIKNLSEDAFRIIDNPENELYFSIASLWEITIKASINKLNLKKSISEIYEDLKMININLIQFTKNDFETLLQLEFFHQDPFDRMIISQAISNNLIIISNDSKFDYYKINRKW